MKRKLTAILLLMMLCSASACGRETEPLSSEDAAVSTETTAAGTSVTTETTTKITTDATTQTTTATTAVTQTTTETTTAETTSVSETLSPETMPSETEPPVYGKIAMHGAVMVTDSGTPQARALELFSDRFKTGERYAQVLNRYQTALGEDVNVYCMVIPTSAAYYLPTEQAGQYGSQLANYEHIAQHLEGVIPVPVYDAIGAHTEEPIYSRTDYHWFPLAAYYAGQEFAKIADVPYADISTYTPVTREGYVGAFYAVNGISELRDAPEQFTYYKPANLDSISCTYYNTAFGNPRESTLFFEDNSIAASYTVYVGRDDCILQVDTNAENDRTLVIFKDSYGNALVPFLTESFSTIYLCDFRYFDLNAPAFMQQVGATDVLFAMSTVASTASGKVDIIEYNLVK